MTEMVALLERWRMDEAEVRRRVYRGSTPRERERWHAVWLLAQALERDAPAHWPMGRGIRRGRSQGTGF